MQGQQLLKETECDVKNYTERGGFYTPRSTILHINMKAELINCFTIPSKYLQVLSQTCFLVDIPRTFLVSRHGIRS